jgi:hypothetical protein
LSIGSKSLAQDLQNPPFSGLKLGRKVNVEATACGKCQLEATSCQMRVGLRAFGLKSK